MHNVVMYEIFKMTLGFVGILLIGIAGVVLSELVRAGEVSGLTTTIDNIAHIR